MPEYLAPGVYVEEVDTGAKPIEGVSTSTSGMVGVTERGPVGVPTFVTSYPDFVRKFGGNLDRKLLYTGSTWYLPHAVEGFFTNGGKRLYVVRVLPDNAEFATRVLFDRGPGGITTFLAGRSRPGDAGLPLISPAGITNGMWLKLENQAFTEYVHVAAAGLDAGIRALRGAYAFNHPVGAQIRVMGPETVAPDASNAARMLTADVARGAMTLTLTTRADLTAGDFLRVGSGAQREYVVIDDPAPTAANTVTLRYPMQFTHVGTGAGAESAVEVTFPAAAAATTALAASAMAGGGLLIVQNATGFPGTDRVVEIAGPAPAQTEYRTIHTALAVQLRSRTIGAITHLDRMAFLHPQGVIVRIVTTVDVAPPPARSLTGAYNPGATRVNLNNATGLVAGLVLRVGAAADVDREYVVLSSVNVPANQVTLTYPLVFPHANGLAVSAVNVLPAANGETLAAERPLRGDRMVILTNFGPPNAFAAGTLMEIAGTSPAENEYRVVDALATAGAVSLQPPLPIHPHGLDLVEVSERAPMLTVQAIDKGVWGDDLRVIVDREDAPLLRETTPDAALSGMSQVRLGTTVGVEEGSILEFTNRDNAGNVTAIFQRKVLVIRPGNVVDFAPATLPQDVGQNTRVRTLEFQLSVQELRTNIRTQQNELFPLEEFRQLSLDPRHTRYVVRVIGPISGPLRADGHTEGESEYIRISDVLPQDQAEAAMRTSPDVLAYTLPSGQRRTFGLAFSGGNDQIELVTPQTYVGADAVDPQNRRGIFALKNIEEIAIVAVPGQTDPLLQQTLLDHCDLMRYRFAVLDARERVGVADIQDQRSLYDSKYGAIYYPWLRIADPFPDNPRIRSQVSIPPSGHVVGIYARSDIERGVHKAPANEVIRGILDLEVSLTKEEQDILNPRNINVIRNFRRINRALRVWGARTVSSDPDWKYVNVRRVFIFVEHSIDRGTQWVVFEPNDERLWARVRRSLTDFLTTVWRNGALQGTKPEEGFFVKCDRETMTDDDINNGRLIVMVGLAVVRPAEFVIFRIGQSRRGSHLFEGA